MNNIVYESVIIQLKFGYLSVKIIFAGPLRGVDRGGGRDSSPNYLGFKCVFYNKIWSEQKHPSICTDMPPTADPTPFNAADTLMPLRLEVYISFSFYNIVS